MDFRDTAARLARGARGRSEADVQADVRAFLLDAPLDLAVADILDVSLEAPVAGGRRIDIEAGSAVIEVKKNLAPSKAFDAAIAQLAGYVAQRTEEGGERYVGVLTDGRAWLLFRHDSEGGLAEVDRFELRSGGEAERLAAWLEVILATVAQVRPTPKEITRRLGATSPAAQLDLADLKALYTKCRLAPEVQLKRELWARLLLSALGSNFEDSDDLFVTHTYLVLLAELVAHRVMGLGIEAPDEGFQHILEGQRFAMAGLHGVVEADFFDWPATIPEGTPVIAAVARRLARFDWGSVEHDVLKVLYESVIDAETRRRLGEYYTPDWLAQKMVDHHYSDPLTQRVLDPACGSGTFLFWAVRRALAAYDASGMSNRLALEKVTHAVQGMDLHPVAVTLARVTYLLALTPERLRERGELTIPVFLGDSVRWGYDDVALGEDGMTVRTSEELELVEDQLHFPEGVVDDPGRFDRLVADLADKAAKRKRGTRPPSVAGLLRRHKVLDEEDRAAVTTAFKKLCRLHDARRDHVWSYYIRNRARPLAFSRPGNGADLLVGNPPWLAYRSMPPKQQDAYKRLAKERRLWAGGKVATQQDLSDVFVARSVELYLKPGGTFSFVMPFAALSRRQFAGFRTGHWPATSADVDVQFDTPDDFARVKPPPFQVAACVVAGSKRKPSSALPAAASVWTGRISDPHGPWAAVASELQVKQAAVVAATDTSESPYRGRFINGATIYPRSLVTVRLGRSTRLGVAEGRMPVRSARSRLEKGVWKTLPDMDGVVERQFVMPMHLGATVVAFRPRTPWRAIVPRVNGQLVGAADDEIDEFPGLASWWREADARWCANAGKEGRRSLLEQVDYQAKLRKQFPIPPHRVVYTKSGQHLAACRIEDQDAVIDHSLYWAPMESLDEARYVCAVLNSRVLSAAILGLQARGQHNPRHFDMHVFALPFPLFDRAAGLHRQLAELGRRAEDVAESVELDEAWQFQKARRVVREALRDDGVADEIDSAVTELIAGEAAKAGVPDLLGVLEEASEQVADVPYHRRSRKQRSPQPIAARNTP